MNLEQLVPPLELCQQIPQGAFADSALVWEEDFCVFGKLPPHVVPREENTYHTIIAPAPTLQEIMAKIPMDKMLLFRFGYDEDQGWGLWNERDCVQLIDNPATAALRLWFSIKNEARATKARGRK